MSDNVDNKVLQTGTVSPRHAAIWTTDGVIEDGGTSAESKLTSLGITAAGDTSFAINDAPVTGPYSAFSLGINQINGALISVDSFNGAPLLGLHFRINGTLSNLFINPDGSASLATGGPFLPLTGGTIQSAGSLPVGQISPLLINVLDLLPGQKNALHITFNNASFVGPTEGDITAAISAVSTNFPGTVDSIWGISSVVVSSSTATIPDGTFPQDVAISSSMFKDGTNRAWGMHITATERTNRPSSINKSLLGLEIGHHANGDDDGGNSNALGLRAGIHLAQTAFTSYPVWVAATVYTSGDIVNPSGSKSFVYICTVGGTSGGTEPTWPTSAGTVVDGSVTWSFNGYFAVYGYGYGHDGAGGSITKSLYCVTGSSTYQVFDARSATAPSNYTDPVAALRMDPRQIIDFNGANTNNPGGWTGPAGSYLQYVNGVDYLRYVSGGNQILSIGDDGLMQFAGELRITSTPGLPALTIFQEEYISFTNANNRTFGFTQIGGNRWRWVAAGTEVFSINDSGTMQTGGTAGPTVSSNSGVPVTVQPKGSLYLRTGGGVGSTLYVSQGGGTWNPVATGGPFLPLAGGIVTGPLNLSGLPSAQSDGSAPVGAATGDLYINGGFVCIAP